MSEGVGRGWKLKTLLLAGTALMPSGAAFAADPPGAHAGAGWGHTNLSDQVGGFFGPAGADTGIDGAGVVAGGQVGCDYQFASNWVIGAAGDFSWASIDGNETDPFFSDKSGTPIALRSRTDFLG